MISNFVCFMIFLRVNFVYPHLKDMGEIEMDVENRIVGGTSTSLKEYPYNVKFFNHGGVCGGVILTSKIVLTAAHCFDYNKNLNDMKIVSHSELTFHISAIQHDIWDFKLHQQYNEPIPFANDIAIIIIHDKFEFGRKAKVVAIANTPTWMNEKEDLFIASGWSNTKNPRLDEIKTFTKTHLHYVSNENCTKMTELQLSPGMFCLYGHGVRDTCKGDSGSGILWKNQIVGIVSYGKGCATKMPGVYTNVYHFKEWIHNSVAELTRRFCSFHDKIKDHLK